MTDTCSTGRRYALGNILSAAAGSFLCHGDRLDITVEGFGSEGLDIIVGDILDLPFPFLEIDVLIQRISIQAEEGVRHAVDPRAGFEFLAHAEEIVPFAGVEKIGAETFFFDLGDNALDGGDGLCDVVGVEERVDGHDAVGVVGRMVGTHMIAEAEFFS